MLAYGVAVLAACYLAGQWIGEWLGSLLHIDANVGGVGFAMALLIAANQLMRRSGWMTKDMEQGIQFWNKMYIPVIVAMSSIQNVNAAFTSGLVAIMAGIIPTISCFLLIPAISRIARRRPIAS